MTCEGCGAPLEGRQRKWCSERCKHADFRRRNPEKNAEYCRRWQREHPERVAKHVWKSCACGKRMSHTATRCRECVAKERQAYRQRIERLWADGLTIREIQETVGSKINVAVLRTRGYDLPHRRTPEQVARLTAANSDRLARAGVVYRASRAA